MPERKQDRNFTMDRENHGESNVWSTAQLLINRKGLDFYVRFE